jgi:hypothetical protein
MQILISKTMDFEIKTKMYTYNIIYVFLLLLCAFNIYQLKIDDFEETKLSEYVESYSNLVDIPILVIVNINRYNDGTLQDLKNVSDRHIIYADRTFSNVKNQPEVLLEFNRIALNSSNIFIATRSRYCLANIIFNN